MDPERFRKQIAAVINMEGRENNSNTPDFLLAEFMESCLVAAEHLIGAREDWYGYHSKPGHLSATESVLLRPSPEQVEQLRQIVERECPYIHQELEEEWKVADRVRPFHQKLKEERRLSMQQDACVKQSKLESGVEAVTQLSNQVGNLEDLTNKLCGSIPEGPTSANVHGPDNMEVFLNGLPGVLGELEKRIISVRDRLERLL
jgi:hypothetical protein